MGSIFCCVQFCFRLKPHLTFRMSVQDIKIVLQQHGLHTFYIDDKLQELILQVSPGSFQKLKTLKKLPQSAN